MFIKDSDTFFLLNHKHIEGRQCVYVHVCVVVYVRGVGEWGERMLFYRGLPNEPR